MCNVDERCRTTDPNELRTCRNAARHFRGVRTRQEPARVPVVTITTQGGVRLPEWFQAFRPTPTCPRGGQTPQVPDPDLLRPL